MKALRTMPACTYLSLIDQESRIEHIRVAYEDGGGAVRDIDWRFVWQARDDCLRLAA
jgi:hypothetical protein